MTLDAWLALASPALIFGALAGIEALRAFLRSPVAD